MGVNTFYKWEQTPFSHVFLWLNKGKASNSIQCEEVTGTKTYNHWIFKINMWTKNSYFPSNDWRNRLGAREHPSKVTSLELLGGWAGTSAQAFSLKDSLFITSPTFNNVFRVNDLLNIWYRNVDLRWLLVQVLWIQISFWEN